MTTKSSSADEELAELARGAAWGLVKGSHIDSSEEGKAALSLRLDILEAAKRAGLRTDFSDEGIGTIYTRAEVEGQ